MSLKNIPLSTKLIVHHFGVGVKLLEDIQANYSSLLKTEEIGDIFWDTNDFLLIRNTPSIWLRSRYFKDHDHDHDQPYWSLRYRDGDYFEETDPSKIVTVLDGDYFEETDPSKIVTALPKIVTALQHLNIPNQSSDIKHIFDLHPKSAITSTRLSCHKSRFHVDCFKIGSKPYVLGSISFNSDSQDDALINFLKDNEGYFPNVRSKVIEDFKYRYPDIVDELINRGIVNKEIISQAHQYYPPIALPEEEEF